MPRGPGSPPVPVMHSPPRPLTVKDQQDWKIPPCISNWKNAKVRGRGWGGGWGGGDLGPAAFKVRLRWVLKHRPLTLSPCLPYPLVTHSPTSAPPLPPRFSRPLQGYTIPLDKRLAADGRGLQEVAINDNFAKFTEALYIAGACSCTHVGVGARRVWVHGGGEGGGLWRAVVA